MNQRGEGKLKVKVKLSPKFRLAPALFKAHSTASLILQSKPPYSLKLNTEHHNPTRLPPANFQSLIQTPKTIQLLLHYQGEVHHLHFPLHLSTTTTDLFNFLYEATSTLSPK